jgi:nitrite reductase (NADH) large subunit
MTTDRRKLVVIGGGVAGASAAQAARDEYPDAEIALFSREPYPFYNKIALNSVITGKRREDHLTVLAPELLESKGIECHWGQGVNSVDLDLSLIRLERGAEVAFDRLILATGASPLLPPIPGIESPGVLPLWSLADAVDIRVKVQSARRLVVIGGGVLGVEAALDLAALGIEVTLVEARDGLMADQLDGRASRWLVEALVARGLRVELGAPVTEVSSIDDKSLVKLGTGAAIEVDLAVLVAGVRPNIDLAQEAGIRTRRGIIVDEHQRTSHPKVLAAGNCVELGSGMCFLWNPAKRQGEVAGLNAFEAKRAMFPRPLTLHSKTPGIPLFVCGRANRSEPGDQVLRSRQGPSYRMLRIDGAGRLVGAICLGDSSW